MISNFLKISLILSVFFSVGIQAQEMTAQELKNKLELRDKAIIELLERVDALESRVGVEKSSQDTKEPSVNDIKSTDKQKMAPGAVVVEEGDAERALERSLTLEGALLLPSGAFQIEPSVTYSRQENTAPGFVSENGQVFASEIGLNADFVTTNLAFRLGLPWDSQLELGLPYRMSRVEKITKVNFFTTEVTNDFDTSFGDVRIGFAKTLFREALWRPDLVARITWDTDTGDGNSFNEISGSLTAIKRQDPVTFIGGLSYQHALKNNEFKPGSLISANFASLIALSPETSMRFAISGAYRQKNELSGTAIKGSDRLIGTFIVGGSTILIPGILLNISLGIGLTEDAEDFSVTISLPIRF